MTDQEQPQVDANDVKLPSRFEHHEIDCPVIGKLNVYMEGSRSSNEVVILTVHDLGCDHTMYQDFVDHPKMCQIRDRTVWIHIDVPGQGQDADDLPADYVFPTMQQLAENMICVLDKLNVKEVVCFGEGAGANILARFAMAHIGRVLGVALIHCTGTTAGFLESLKDLVIKRKLDNIGMNPTAESYLMLHRFGSTESSKISKQVEDKEQLQTAIENYQSVLRTRVNPKNLKKFVEAFLKRTNIAEKINKLTCHVLFVTGQRSVFNATTRGLHQAMIKSCGDKGKVEFIEVIGVANVLEEKPEKLAESFQYFLQGLGLVSSVPMHHVTRPPRLRSMSMEEYDKPMRSRSFSGDPPLGASPPKVVEALPAHPIAN